MPIKLLFLALIGVGMIFTVITGIRLAFSYRGVVRKIRVLYKGKAITLPANLTDGLDSWYTESWQSQLFQEMTYGDISWAQQDDDLSLAASAVRRGFKWFCFSNVALFMAVPLFFLVFR